MAAEHSEVMILFNTQYHRGTHTQDGHVHGTSCGSTWGQGSSRRIGQGGGVWDGVCISKSHSGAGLLNAAPGWGSSAAGEAAVSK